jgi:hypothetical protein
MKTQTEKKVIVAFHIGRGGQFYNAGHKTYIGEKNLNDLIKLNDLYYYDNEDREEGEKVEEGWYDAVGNFKLTKEEGEQETGIIDLDGEFDTDIVRYLEDCTESELKLIAESNESKSYQLENELKELLKN